MTLLIMTFNVVHIICLFDVVPRCKFQRWNTQHCINVDLTFSQVTTSRERWNNVEILAGITNIFLFKFISRNVRKKCGVCSKLQIQILERCQWRPSGVLIVNFEYISHPSLVFLLPTLNKWMFARQPAWFLIYKTQANILQVNNNNNNSQMVNVEFHIMK